MSRPDASAWLIRADLRRVQPRAADAVFGARRVTCTGQSSCYFRLYARVNIHAAVEDFARTGVGTRSRRRNTPGRDPGEAALISAGGANARATSRCGGLREATVHIIMAEPDGTFPACAQAARLSDFDMVFGTRTRASWCGAGEHGWFLSLAPGSAKMLHCARCPSLSDCAAAPAIPRKRSNSSRRPDRRGFPLPARMVIRSLRGSRSSSPGDYRGRVGESKITQPQWDAGTRLNMIGSFSVPAV